MTTDQALYQFLQEITSEIQKSGRSRAEAVARINERWAGMVFIEPDLITHEEAEHWAHVFYYVDARYWDVSEDRSTWTVTEAPSKKSRSWTLKE